MQSRRRRFANAIGVLAAAGTIFALVLCLVPVWPFTLFEHFRVQYVVLGMLVVAACAALRLRGWLDAAAIATLVHVLWLVPDLVRERRPLPASGDPLRVLLFNVLSSNTQYGDVRRLIDETNADVVALLEVKQHWFTELAPSLARYPSRFEAPRTDNFGLALYARGTLTNARTEYLGAFPSIVATLHHGGRRVEVIVTHPMPPVRGEYLDLLHAQLGALAAHVRTLSQPTLLVGDFNSSPWSRPFRELMDASGLCDSRAGFGIQATFPASFAPMRIPIDHVLVSCDIGVRDRWIGADVGSDHLPVVVDLVIP